MQLSSAFNDKIRVEQAKTALDSLAVTLAASLAIMTSASGMLLLYSHKPLLIAWLALFVLFTLYRALHGHRLKAKNLAETAPGHVLKVITWQSVLAGCGWGLLPLIFIGELETVGGAFVVFIIAGTSAGALIQSTSYAPPAMGFYLPALLATVIALLVEASPASAMIGFNVFLLAGMMVRQSLKSEQSYRQTERLRFDATELASSLAEANRRTLAANSRLNHLARNDTLTQLNNRASLNDALEARLADLAVAADGLALVIVDLDNFKVINDTQGHGAGDRVLQEAAARIRALTGDDDFVARLGGDEFALLIPGPEARARAVDLSDGIIASLSRPIVIDERMASIGASIGIALFPQDGLTPADLLSSADIALYAAKKAGRRRFAQFDAPMKRRLDAQRRIEGDLARAISEFHLAVVFQPQVDLVTGDTIGHEALIRWAHPDLGNIRPPDIVAAARATHQNDRLTGYVVNAACEFLKALTRLGDHTSIVSINVSPTEFQLYSPADLVLDCIRRHGVAAWRLEVEITEEAILDTRTAGQDLKRLAAAGVRLAIDDFGAGRFSLSDTVALDLDRIKIDRSFIAHIDGNERQQMLVDTVLALARKLNVEVLAEGVETPEEAATLVSIGCRKAQGYFFAFPLAGPQALARLEREIANRPADRVRA